MVKNTCDQHELFGNSRTVRCYLRLQSAISFATHLLQKGTDIKYISSFTKIKNMVLVLKKGATKKQMLTIEKKLQKETLGVDTKKYCGSIKLKIDPLTFQNQVRNEWK